MRSRGIKGDYPDMRERASIPPTTPEHCFTLSLKLYQFTLLVILTLSIILDFLISSGIMDNSSFYFAATVEGVPTYFGGIKNGDVTDEVLQFDDNGWILLDSR